MKYLIACAGSAGHITPALAVAKELKRLDSKAEIVFAGTPDGIENRLVPKAGYRLRHIPICGLQRSLSPKNLKAVYLALRSPSVASEILEEVKPDVIFATGGYITWPVSVAAQKRDVPMIVHEANAKPGLAIRMSEKNVSRILLNYDTAKQYLKFPGKSLHVGMPVSVAPIDREKRRREYGLSENDKLILSFSGSLGSSTVNNIIYECMDSLSRNPHIYWLHGCGQRHYGDSAAWREKFPENRMKTLSYIENATEYMQIADICITRAGAATLAELERVGAASILIPSPYVTDDHQTKNALALEKDNAAVLIPEKELSAERLADTINRLFESNDDMKSMKDAIHAFSTSDAAFRIAKILISSVSR